MFKPPRGQSAGNDSTDFGKTFLTRSYEAVRIRGEHGAHARISEIQKGCRSKRNVGQMFAITDSFKVFLSLEDLYQMNIQ